MKDVGDDCSLLMISKEYNIILYTPRHRLPNSRILNNITDSLSTTLGQIWKNNEANNIFQFYMNIPKTIWLELALKFILSIDYRGEM